MRAQLELDLFATPVAPPPVVVDGPDPLAARIVSSGLVVNEYLLSLNSSFDISCGDLPSRALQWPVQYIEPEAGHEGRILLTHPDFASYPFVDEIEEKTGFRPVWEPKDEFGRDRGANWRYFHAVDLLTDAHWRDLIETRNFTDDKSIMLGLCYHADYGGLNNENARAVLAAIRSKEPRDKSAAYLRSSKVRIAHCQQGKFVSMESRDAKSVWATIHGLETKLFKRESRSGHLRFSPAFLAEKEAQASLDAPTPVSNERQKA